MKKIIATLFSLIALINLSFGQGGKDLPILEDFETQNEWPWMPWNINISGNGTSTKSSRSSHEGKFGLIAGSYFYRTDKVIGTPGQVLSFWVRFTGPSRAHCGFGFHLDSSMGYFLCVDPSTNSLHFARSPDYTYPILKSVKQTYKLNIWYRVEIQYNSQTNITGKLYKSDGVTIVNSISIKIPNLHPGGISFRGDGTGIVQVDEIRGGTRIALDSSETLLVAKKGEPIILKNILFETDKSVLIPSSYIELNRLVRYLKTNSFTRVEIDGHTDNTGNEEHNIKLSLERAKAVAEYLVTMGVNRDKIFYKGLGSSLPIASNDSEEGRNKNRRVEFTIH